MKKLPISLKQLSKINNLKGLQKVSFCGLAEANIINKNELRFCDY